MSRLVLLLSIVLCFPASLVASSPGFDEPAGDIARMRTAPNGMTKREFERLLPKQRSMICGAQTQEFEKLYYPKSRLIVTYLNGVVFRVKNLNRR
jgi:hypothetical protein